MFEFLKKLFGGGEPAGYVSLSDTEFQEKFKAAGKPLLLDVRSKAEFDRVKMPNALNIDIFSPNFQKRVSQLDKSKALFVYCQSGNRSARACKVLAKEGFTEVYNLKGGIGGYTSRTV